MEGDAKSPQVGSDTSLLKTSAQAIGSTLGKIAAKVGLGKRKEKESEPPKVAKQPAAKAKTRQKAIRRMAANSSITRGQKPAKKTVAAREAKRKAAKKAK